jgi:hypothetical protein
MYAALFERTNPGAHPQLRIYYSDLYDRVLELLQSPELLGLLEAITGAKYELNTFFFSRYNVGDL